MVSRWMGAAGAALVAVFLTAEVYGKG